ncbi:MAG: glycosyltransferase [Cyanobacteria bacterium P01_D01_bin.1]
MRKLLFLLPGTTQRFFAGGLTAELNALAIAQQICPAEVVTYRQREDDALFLDDLLAAPVDDSCIFVVSWGFDVPKLLKRLGDRPTIYHAHSTGYRFRIPARVPILAVSNNTMGYWGEQALGSLIYHLPNEISPAFENRQGERDIDVLVQTRKSSEYLLQQLLPALKEKCNVVVLDSYVEDLVGLFNRTKVYLYDSAEYWGRYGLSEGFGLPPMEALACGTQVFSSVNHALSDYLDPGFNCHKIAGYSTSYDVHRILEVVHRWESLSPASGSFFAPYRRENLVPRFATILSEINQFFDRQPSTLSDIPQLTRSRIAWLSIRKIVSKLSHLR